MPEDSFTALGRNVARPIAGRAKLIVGFSGECCLGEELDEVGDDADEDDVMVSVEPFKVGDVEIGRVFAEAIRAALAAAKGLTG